MTHSALLALEDGTIFSGTAIGAEGSALGEVVFNTSMTGYQELLTNPASAQQIPAFTYPHIGNTGTNAEDEESSRIHAQGIVIRDLPQLTSNFRSQQSLSDYLKAHNIVGIADIDTRKLTRILRESGAQAGCIMAGAELDEAKAVAAAKGFSGIAGKDLVSSVTTNAPYGWQQGGWSLGEGFSEPDAADLPYHVVVYDFGVTRNVLRNLVNAGCRLTVVPANTSSAEVLALKPDGVLLSNGPGDPQGCHYALSAIKALLAQRVPLFGMGLGHLLLGLAGGASSYQLKHGHYGANHPVKELSSDKVIITQQGYGFALDAASLPESIKVSHTSLFDGTVHGVQFTDTPAFSFQGTPQATSVTGEAESLFAHFIDLIKQHSAKE
ncbi:MAG: glutamine-hydrolyzing carbamoyl-phosphate synthase small subunit [Aeromonadales bacterium]|nr:glutamine-hydrolyzing carbamoyl-phosphate synthase small subunit [Aeromonadales bacterium]